MGRTVAKTGPAARRKGETDEGYAARVWALRKLGLVDDDNKTTSRTQLAVRREFRWVAAAAAITGAGAWAVTTHGVLGWLAVGACLYGARPARRVWGWTKPRRDAIVPDPRGPRALYEKLVPGARARGTAARLNGRWLSICREAKWTRGTGTDERAPSLIYCRAESDDTIAIAWRPWINDQENTWERQANIVKQAIGAPTVRWWTNDGDSGILEVRIGITPLPPKVVLHSPPPPATPDAGCAIYLGPMAGGGDVYWRPVDSPHLFVTGETGGGKGVAIRLMLAQVVLHCRVLIINTKDSGEFGWLNDHPNVEIVGIEALPDDPTEEQVRAAEQAMRRTAAAAIRRVGSERIRRQGIVKRANVDRWCDLTGPNTFPPYFVFVDETAQLLEDTSDEAAVNAAEELREIARMARSAGISLVLATQRGDVATLGANGGSLRNNLTGGLGVGGLDQDGLGMLTRGRVKADLGVLRKRIKGRAIALGLDSEGGAEVSVVQIAYLSQETAGGTSGWARTPPRHPMMARTSAVSPAQLIRGRRTRGPPHPSTVSRARSCPWPRPLSAWASRTGRCAGGPPRETRGSPTSPTARCACGRRDAPPGARPAGRLDRPQPPLGWSPGGVFWSGGVTLDGHIEVRFRRLDDDRRPTRPDAGDRLAGLAEDHQTGQHGRALDPHGGVHPERFGRVGELPDDGHEHADGRPEQADLGAQAVP